MQTYSVHPHHITWCRTDFQHSVLLVVWLNVYTVVTIHLTLCGARQQNFCHKILFRTLNSCFIYVWAYVIRHTHTHTSKIVICICQMDYIHKQVLLPTNCINSHIRSRVQKFPAWHTKAAPNGKCWGIYSAIYELLVHRCEKCVEIKGDCVGW